MRMRTRAREEMERSKKKMERKKRCKDWQQAGWNRKKNEGKDAQPAKLASKQAASKLAYANPHAKPTDQQQR